MPKKSKLILIFLFIFSFSIRFWQLDKNPIGFFCDEASAGYDAYSILKTGKDRHDDFFPIFFKSFNYDNVGPFQIYPTIPFIAVFGLNETAVRLMPVVLGSIEIILFYLLLTELIPVPFALIGAFFLSICPWHFHLSRINIGEYVSWTFLTLLACLLFVKAVKNNKLSFFLLSSIFFGLATYSYTPARLITPIIFSLIICFVFLSKKFKAGFLMILTFLIILIPFLNFYLNNQRSFQRMKDTSGIDLKNQELMSKINYQQLFNNFTKKYFLHYSDTFLFQKGDTDFPGQFIRRHSIANLGLFYPYQIILILLGGLWLFYLIFRKKKYYLMFIVILFFLFPIADSLTSDLTPYSTRSYLGLIPFNILSSFGFYVLYKIVRKLFLKLKIRIKILNILYIITVLIIFIYSFGLLINRFINNPLTTSDYWGWQYGPREIVNYFKQNQQNYDDLIMTGSFNGADIFFNFYAPDNCQKCLLGDLTLVNKTRRQLFAMRPEEINLDKRLISVKKILYYPDGSLAFLFFEII